MIWVIVLVGLLLIPSQSAIYSYSQCDTGQFLVAKNLSCSSCAATKISNIFSPIGTDCLCEYPPFADSSCRTTPPCSTNQILSYYSLEGVTSANSATCIDCDPSAYPNQNKTQCIPCPPNMKYEGSACVCSDPSFMSTEKGCFADPGLIVYSASVYQTQLKYLAVGCHTDNDLLSCSHIVNLCTQPECQFLTAAGLTSYIYPIKPSFTWSAGSYTKDSSLNFKLITYLATGNYVGESVLYLSDIMRCGLPSLTTFSLSIGNNIKSVCTYNFNNLVAKLGSKRYKNKVYQLLLQGQDDKYYDINVYMDSSTQPVTRFFLEDAYTSTEQVTVLTNFKFQISMNQVGDLNTPNLYLQYKTLQIQPGIGISPQSQSSQTLSYEINYTYNLDTFWVGALGVFITINILVILHTIAKTYVGYLNRKSTLLFFLNLISLWSLWMFYFLLIMTAYWFFATKLTQDVYIFISKDDTLYTAFYVIMGLMCFFRLLSVVIEKLGKLSSEVFMLNWEKGKFSNSWREIFIVNSLAEFYTHRTVSIFWMLIVLLFFMTGLDWQDHSAETIHTSLPNITDINPKNPIYLYFLGCSIFLSIGIIFKLLRRISVLKWPYPFENFVDYCNVTNISFFFAKKRSAEAHYIHASIPDRMEVTHKQINEAVRRGLQQKNRSIENEITSQDNLKIYTIFMSEELEDRFITTLRKEQEMESNRDNKHSHGSSKKLLKQIDYREDFIERRLKPTLQNISREGHTRTKTTLESQFGLPPMDLRGPLKNNEILLDTRTELISEIFPNGNEFEDIVTNIIIFLVWLTIFSSAPIAAMLTYFVDEYLISAFIGERCRQRLEKMTKVKEGFML